MEFKKIANLDFSRFQQFYRTTCLFTGIGLLRLSKYRPRVRSNFYHMFWCFLLGLR